MSFGLERKFRGFGRSVPGFFLSRRPKLGSCTMAFCRYAVVMAITLMGWALPARAQQPPRPDKKQDAVAKVVVYDIRDLAEKADGARIVKSICSIVAPAGG